MTKRRTDEEPETVQGLKSVIRLNKYLADAGICSRREADRLIESGVVEINGVVVTELGTKVGPNDKVRYGGESLKREKLKYVLLNKPKGFISTSDDPLDRKTVMSLVENACKERIYSVGRLDRNTTGLLLFTNDGDMAKRLTHPKHGVRKLYHVTLDKALTKNDMLQILKGVELEDGIVQPDKIDWVENVESKTEVGIELHSGKNRVVRRIFEHLGYQVEKLDRVVFAGLTKKDIPRGKWRLLSDKEVDMLKML
ncbi:MAG: pseudouridine synthase [Bacteroidetes bacterium HGW-Bacteroidetes-16]|nr:MAG: pseudouridine synthase [Bacteroidetes bacterium HGW-Bacteroidetes-16]